MNLRHRYEELRGQVLEGVPSGCRMGLALMLREGMAGWIEGWAAAEAPETVSCCPGSASPPRSRTSVQRLCTSWPRWPSAA